MLKIRRLQLLFIVFCGMVYQGGFAQGKLLTKEELGKTKEYLDLKEALKKPAKVYRLSLWDMELKEISPKIAQLTNVQQLRISHNELEKLPAEFIKLIKVQRINMEHNNFEVFPVELLQLVQLERLDLHKNKLKEIPAEIAKLTLLEELDLHANQITQLPLEALAKLKYLKYINLIENPLQATQVEELKKKLPNTKINF